MEANLLGFSKARNLILMVGAGVSAGKPSALPGWKPLNAAIFHALAQRLQAGISGRIDFEQLESLVENERNFNRFPPDYQAQLIHEMCGERYFQALQALDVDTFNAAHASIAALAQAGAIRAIVTTNFDRLIERALEQRQIPFEVVYDESGFAHLSERLSQNTLTALPIIKIHGCVSAHLSMIDTLKQRKLGRSRQLTDCLKALHSSYWMYLGFSAADLETDPDYLGLITNANNGPGATYIAFPGHPALGAGAQQLMDAYGDRGQVVVAEVASHLTALCQQLGAEPPQSIPAETELGRAQFQTRLKKWADQLSTSAAGLGCAAILEAIGQGEAAVRILDRLVRKEIYDERDTPDFQALQLHYGRLGASWGRFINVPDLHGAASNASVEAVQSLFRLQETEWGFPALGWCTLMLLWMGEGSQASAIADWVIGGHLKGSWNAPQPRSSEAIVDAWLAAAQVYIMTQRPSGADAIEATAGAIFELAVKCGDVVRIARVRAIQLLNLSASTEQVIMRAEGYEQDFAEAKRVGDIYAQAIRSLAIGRWLVGNGRQLYSATESAESRAHLALSHLDQAMVELDQLGMDPWLLYGLLQKIKLFADLQQFDAAQAGIDHMLASLDRFPILASHTYEVIGQILFMQHNPAAADAFREARAAAIENGLPGHVTALDWYLDQMTE
ncbi:MAG: SIR2 family protein [Anaerolineae bacterium]|nr:SIR2 family protein [Anaerolineae bacterium]